MKEFGYTLVSGCPRSGTSLTMDILRVMFGEDLILGSKFPQDRGNKEEQLKKIKDSEDLTPIEKYFMSRQFDTMPPEALERLEKSKDMNPNGFWECAFSVRGIQYLPMMKEELEKVMNMKKIVKVVSQGLLMSNPLYINRIIFLIRHPRAVAKSQERLERGQHVLGDDGKTYNIMNGPEAGPDGEPIKFKWHEPDMFINVSLQALQFMKHNKDIPVMFVEFEDLVENPEINIRKMYDFTGMEGDVEKGCKVVEPRLNRSRHEDVELSYWCDAEYVYDALLQLKKLYEQDRMEEVDNLVDTTLEYMSDPKREIHQEKTRWKCFRAKKVVCRKDCLGCMAKDPKTIYAFKKNSEALGTERWETQPCPFECGMDAFNENPISIEESIKNNHWVTSGFSSDAPSPLVVSNQNVSVPQDEFNAGWSICTITQDGAGFGPGHDGTWELVYRGVNKNGEHIWSSDRTRETDFICMCYTPGKEGSPFTFAFSPDQLAEGNPYARFEYATADGHIDSGPSKVTPNGLGTITINAPKGSVITT